MGPGGASYFEFAMRKPPASFDSVDIIDRFTAFFSAEWNLQGPFMFQQSILNAPNPVLTVSPLGTIGLPLGSHDTEQLKRIASSSSGAEANARNSVWEVDATKVTFGNPTWSDTFISKLGKEVCETLGINSETCQPRYELRKLTLYGPGYSTPLSARNVSSEDVFATMSIVLPSAHTGGSSILRYAGQTVQLNGTSESLSDLTATAWYSEVMHESKPISSGFRMELLYELINTKLSLRPGPSHNKTFADTIKPILLYWKNSQKGKEVETIVYRLSTKRLKGKATLTSLEKHHAQMVLQLSSAAKEQGFCVGLASVVSRLRGSGAVYDDRCFTCPPDPWEEIYSHDATVEDLVDFAGNTIADTLHLSEGVETIPEDLYEDVEDEEWEKEEWSAYDAGVQRWYRCPAVVIWPQDNDYAMRCGTSPEKLAEACRTISTFNEDTTREDKTAILEFVLHRCKDVGPNSVAESVCSAALAWKDPSLWLRAVRAASEHGGVGIFSDLEKMWELVATLGFECVSSGARAMLDHEKTNAGRAKLLSTFAAWLKTVEDPEMKSNGHAWHIASTQIALDSLRLPALADGDHIILLAWAVEHGGLSCLQERILPQVLASQADSDFLKEFALHVVDSRDLNCSADQKQPIISALMTAAISLFDAPISPTKSLPIEQLKKVFESAKASLEMCIHTCPDIAGQVLVKACAFKANTSNVQKCEYICTVLVPLFACTMEKIKMDTVPQSLLEAIRDLNVTAARYFPPCPDDRQLSPLYARSLAQFSCRDSNTWSLFRTAILPSILTGPLRQNGDFLAAFMEELCLRRGPKVDGGAAITLEISDSIGQLTKAYCSLHDVRHNVDMLSGAFERCVQTGAYRAMEEHLCRVFTGKQDDPRDRTTLLKMIPLIHRHAVHFGVADQVASVVQTALLAWVKETLMQNDENHYFSRAVESYSSACRCADCGHISGELRRRNGSAQQIRKRKLTPERKQHITETVQKHLSRWVTVTAGVSDKQLMICVNDRRAAHNVLEDMAIGQAVLAGLGGGSDANLQRILGAHYAEITVVMRGGNAGKRKASPVASSSSSSANPASVPGPSSDTDIHALKKRKTS